MNAWTQTVVHRTSVACTAALLLACESTGVTEIVVVVDSDLSSPDDIDMVRVDVRGLGEQPIAAADLRDTPLPLTLGLVHEGGPLGPISIEVAGLLGFDEVVVERRHRVYFVPESVRVLRMLLLRECVGVECAAGETCARGGCRSVDLDPTELPEWVGAPEPLAHDAGVETYDAGDVDSGSETDAGPPDSGIDAGAGDAGPPTCPPTCASTVMCSVFPRCRCEADTTCTLDCMTGRCNAECVGSSQCHLQRSGGTEVDVDCRDDATCTVEVDSISRASITCYNRSECDLDCASGVSDCEVGCRDSARCILRCGDAETCTMSDCSGPDEMDCGGGVITCRRPCP